MVRKASSGSVTDSIRAWMEAQRMRPPTPSWWWLACLALGIATLVMTGVLSATFPDTAAAMLSGYGQPVLAFEFATTLNDLTAIFGTPDDPMRAARLAAMQAGNEQDYLYMLLYAAFLASGLYALWRELRLPLLLVAVGMPVLAAMFDAYENWLLFDIQAAFTLGEYSDALDALALPVTIKFVLLTLTNLAIGHAMTRMEGKGWQIGGALVMVPCLATLMALIAPAAFGWTLSAAIGAGWIGLIIMAGIACWYLLRHRAPLVDFEPGALPPVRDMPAAAPAATPAKPGTVQRPATFGRRRSDEDS